MKYLSERQRNHSSIFSVLSHLRSLFRAVPMTIFFFVSFSFIERNVRTICCCQRRVCSNVFNKIYILQLFSSFLFASVRYVCLVRFVHSVFSFSFRLHFTWFENRNRSRFHNPGLLLKFSIGNGYRVHTIHCERAVHVFLCITELNVVRRSLVRFWSSTSSYNDIASTIFRRFSFRCISFGLSIGLRCRKTIILIHSVCKHMRKYCAQTQRRRQVTCPWQRSCNRNTNMKNSHIISKRMSANSIASFALMVRALYAVIVLILWQKRHQSRIFHIPNSHLMPKHLRRRWNETKRFKCEAKRVNEKRWQPGEIALKRKKRRISNYNQ